MFEMNPDKSIHINLSGQNLIGKVILPASKSESNRALIIAALSKGSVEIQNLSEAEDTMIMKRLLHSTDEILDTGDAGTVMRFLTAYFAFQLRDVMLTGSPRMYERPIHPLVNALRELGADIHYPGKEGFPPLAIYGKNSGFGSTHIQVPGNISSQFLSALLMIGPTLPDGITLEVTSELFSGPYLQMTIAIMESCGIDIQQNKNIFRISRQNYSSAIIDIESDWSAAAYFYFLLALSDKGEILMPGLKNNSLQGDSQIAKMMKALGIETHFSSEGATLKKIPTQITEKYSIDFRDCPDLAQGMIVFLTMKKIPAIISGLESLRIKETNRIVALGNELGKFGIQLNEFETGKWELNGDFKVPETRIEINTYGDHRMAMAFAQMGFLPKGIFIQSPTVVKKSFPGFWEELDKIK